MAAPVSQTDFTPPTVSSIAPAGGTSNVPLATTVSATFSEAMSASSIRSSSFELRSGTNQAIAAAVTFDAASDTATLRPAAPLSAGVTYTAIVHGGPEPAVQDRARHP